MLTLVALVLAGGCGHSAAWTCTGGCDATAGTWGPLPATGRAHLTVAEIQTTSR